MWGFLQKTSAVKPGGTQASSSSAAPWRSPCGADADTHTMGVASSGNATVEVSSPLTTHTQRSGFFNDKWGACCLNNETQASRRAFIAVASSSATHGGKQSASVNPAARFTQQHQIGTVFDSASGKNRPRRVASTSRAPL